MTQQPAPGWYPNPSGAKGKLYWDGQQWTQGPPPEVTKQASTKTVLIVCGAILAVVLAISLFSGGKDDEKRATESASSAAPIAPAPTVPAYTFVNQPGENAGQYIDVTVDQAYTLDQYRQIVSDLRDKFAAGNPDGFWVAINCSTGGGESADNRLANGRFGIGPLGAARTGVPEGSIEVSENADRKCPADPLPTAPAGSVSAQEVVDAIAAAGVPVINPRDNSQNMCQEGVCVQLITTDEFSVYQFMDVESAAEWASAFPSGHQNGPIFIRYSEGGSNPTDTALIPEINAVVDNLMAGR